MLAVVGVHTENGMLAAGGVLSAVCVHAVDSKLAKDRVLMVGAQEEKDGVV